MAPIDFKLSKPFESTRRASFPERPSWPTLAGRIGYLYEIPEERVGVSYLDSDGDEITLSSDSELQEYYQNNAAAGTIRFTVHNLGPNARRPAPEAVHPRSSLFGGSGGTFGAAPNSFDAFGTGDGDWQTIAGLIDSGPHAFVESVPSEGTASKRASIFSSSTETDLGRVITPTLWKGKARAVDSDSDQDSSRSVLGMDGPMKPLVHVMAANPFHHIPAPPPVQATQSDVSATILNTAPSRPLSTVGADVPQDTVPNSPQAVTALEAPGSPIPAPQSIPPSTAQAQPNSPASAATPEACADNTPEPQAASPNPTSLYTDFAAFLTTAATVFSQHPELGEGLRNIVSNATNGAYLGANASNFRSETEQGIQNAQARLIQGLQTAQTQMNQSMERAQEQVGQATTQARSMEDFVHRRVEEAVGGIFNALGGAPAAPATPRQESAQAGTTTGSPPRNEDTRSTRVPLAWSMSRDRSSFQPQSSFGHALNNWLDTVVPPGMQPPQAPQAPLAPQPPLPPQPPRVPQAPRVPPPPVPRSPSWSRGPRAMPPVSPLTRGASLGRRPVGPPSQPAGPRRQSTVGMPAPEPVPASAPASAPAPPAPKSAREALEESKQLYKAAKAAYRAEREVRRGRGESLSGDAGAHSSSETERGFPRAPVVAPSSTAVQDPIASITSLARSRYPPVELVSASVASPPRRANTIAAPPSVRAPIKYAPAPVSVEAEHVTHPETYARVERRLADMGFAESMYPSLPEMIQLHLRGDAPTRDEEEEIVTRLLEELLSFSPPQQPVASSSRRQLFD